MTNKSSVFSFIWQYLFIYRYKLLIPIVFALGVALNESISPYLLKMIIDTAVQYSDMNYNNILSHPTLLPGFAYVILTEVVNILFRMKDYFKMKVLPSLKAKIIEDTYQNLLNYPYTYFINHFNGDITNKIFDLSRAAEKIIFMIVDMLLWRTFSIIIASITMYYIDPKFTLLTLIWSIIFVCVTVTISQNIHLLSHIFSQSRSLLYGKIIDTLTNILSVKLFNNIEAEQKRFDQKLRQTQKEEMDLHRGILKIGFYQGFCVTLFTAIMLSLLLYLLIHNLITLGEFTLIIIMSGTIIRNIYSISTDLLQFSKEIGECAQALSLIYNQRKMNHDKTAIKPDLKLGGGEIQLKDVTFNHEKMPNLFTKLNLYIKKGEKIGLVGASGSGKTTMINLLIKIFEPKDGAIYIDGQNLQAISTKSLCNAITMVPQDPILFNRSILDNIRFAKPTAPEQEIYDAAKLAYCHDFIIDLPEGYNTLVGERGIKLSGGQKQRIAIARAFLRQAAILIMDEATSALDSITEAKIQQNLASLMANATSIVITHRLSTLKNLDRLILFDQGKILGFGTHDELLDNNLLYQNFWQQFNEF